MCACGLISKSKIFYIFLFYKFHLFFYKLYLFGNMSYVCMGPNIKNPNFLHIVCLTNFTCLERWGMWGLGGRGLGRCQELAADSNHFPAIQILIFSNISNIFFHFPQICLQNSKHVFIFPKYFSDISEICFHISEIIWFWPPLLMTLLSPSLSPKYAPPVIFVSL